MPEISWKFVGKPYDLNSILTPDQVWEVLDLPPQEVRLALNSLIQALNSVEEGNSGADNLGMAPIPEIDESADTVQSIVEAFVSRLQSVTDGNSGGDFVKLTEVTGLTGDTVQALIESLKAYVDSQSSAQSEALSVHKSSADHDARYHTKEELVPYLRGGDTLIKYEVFKIINSNNGDGTFTYQDKNKNLHTGDLTEEGYQIFTLLEGNYDIGQNRIEATVNDTLQRSKASGGLEEIDETHVALTMPEGAGAEITFKYYERVGITGTGLIILSEEKPPDSYFWFEEVG